MTGFRGEKMEVSWKLKILWPMGKAKLKNHFFSNLCFLESILFWYSSEFFRIPNSFSSGSRIPRLPLLSLCILLCVPCLHSTVPLPTPSVCRAIPKCRDFRNLESGAWSRKCPPFCRHRGGASCSPPPFPLWIPGVHVVPRRYGTTPLKRVW